MLLRQQYGSSGSCDYIYFLKMPILWSKQYVTFKYGDFQKASRISLREPFISINSIVVTNKIRRRSCMNRLLQNTLLQVWSVIRISVSEDMREEMLYRCPFTWKWWKDNCHHHWKCNFPMTWPVHVLVGRLVDRSVIISSEGGIVTLPCSSEQVLHV